MHIRFDIPADPAYPGRVAAVLSGVRLRRYGYIGAVLLVIGVLGVTFAQGLDLGGRFTPLWTAMVVSGGLSVAYPPWVRFRARRRSSRYAVDGSYEITDANIMMRSGTETGGIAWDGVSRVAGTPEFWIVFVGRMPATVIPRTFMPAGDAETLAAFMAARGLTAE